MDNQQILQELSELIQLYYDGSFSQMVYDYIQTTGMTQPEIEKLLETIGQQVEKFKEVPSQNAQYSLIKNRKINADYT